MNILILTDFSSTAEHAGKYAVDLFRESSINFYLLNIQNLNFRGTLLSNTLLGIKQLTKEKIQKQEADLSLYSSENNHKFHTILSDENLVAATRRFVFEKKIELIVMGTSSSDPTNKSVLGKHAREIIQKIKCNILAISEKSKFQIPKKFVMPIDNSLSVKTNMAPYLNGTLFNENTCITIMEIGMPEAKSKKYLSIKDHFNIEEISSQYSLLEFKTASNLNDNLLKEIQEYYNMIILLGKNLSICNKLLHSYNGEWESKNNKLPMLVLHEKF